MRVVFKVILIVIVFSSIGFGKITDESNYPSKDIGDVCGYICGNVDNDENGNINVLDITYLISYLYKTGQPPFYLASADIKYDNSINILDITYLITYLYKSGPAPKCYSDPLIFSLSSQSLGNTRSFGIEIADIDLDNDSDLVYVDYIGETVIWLNNGGGLFYLSGQDFPISEVHDIGVGDLNGDSYPDIFFVSHSSPCKVYFGNGSGGFFDSDQNIGTSTDYPAMIILEDMDNDNDIDAFISYPYIPNRIWLNDGTGNFTMGDGFGGSDASRMDVADFNGDGYPDFYLGMRSQPDQVWLADGLGGFTNTGQSFGYNIPNDISCADIDGDGDIDIAVVDGTTDVTILLNQDNTGMFVYDDSNIELGAIHCHLFDADLDGDNDLVTVDYNDGNKLWLNDGTGNFSTTCEIFGNDMVFDIKHGDLDSDGDLEIVFGKLENSANKIFFNQIL